VCQLSAGVMGTQASGEKKIQSGERQSRGHGEATTRERRAAGFPGQGGEDLETTDASRSQASVTHCSRSNVFSIDNGEF